jgi:hypothetical protein
LFAAEEPADDDEQIELTPLRYGSISLFTENDKYFAGTDRNDTNGFKLSALTKDLKRYDDSRLPAPVRFVGGFLEQQAQSKVGISLGQNIYTPSDVETTDLQPDDRPYAAWLYLGASYHNYRVDEVTDADLFERDRLDVFEINIGMVGEWALGEEVQNFVHSILNIAESQGWDNQINNEPGINLIYERKWRYSTKGSLVGWGTELIPRAGFSLGNVFTYANAGVELRAGYRLPADFGTSLIRAVGDSNASSRTSFNVFVFVSAEGRGILRDITLDGNTFSDSHSVDKEGFVYDVASGIGIGITHFQLTYAQARRSNEFKLQEEPQQFGSLSLSYFF